MNMMDSDPHQPLLKNPKMLIEQRKRVERAISNMVDEIYRSNLRKMQSEMHSCAARCCENSRGTIESVQACIEDCATPLAKAQDYVSHEIGQFQGRMHNCIMQCNDEVRSRMPENPKEADRQRLENQFERCAVQCVDKHLAHIPLMMKSIKIVLEKGPNAIIHG